MQAEPGDLAGTFYSLSGAAGYSHTDAANPPDKRISSTPGSTIQLATGRAKQKTWKRQFCGRVRVPSTLGGTGQNILASIRSHHSPPPLFSRNIPLDDEPHGYNNRYEKSANSKDQRPGGNLSRDPQISGLQGDGLRPELVIRYSQFPQIPHRRQWIILMLVRSGTLIEGEAEVLWGQSLHMQRDANGEVASSGRTLVTGTSRGRGCWRRTRATVRGLGDGLLIVRTIGAGAEGLIPSATYKIDHMIHFPSVPPSFPSFPLLYVACGMPYAGLYTLFLLVLLDTQYASTMPESVYHRSRGRYYRALERALYSHLVVLIPPTLASSCG